MTRRAGRLGTTPRWRPLDLGLILPIVAALPILPLSNPFRAQAQLASDAVPQLYRQILDLVAELERMGARREAARGRAAAIAAYSGGWNDATRRRLEHNAETLTRRLAGPSVRTRLHLG